MSNQSRSSTPLLSLERYAQVVSEFGRGGVELAVVLARNGISASQWEAAERYWQERIDREVEEDEDGVAPILGEYAAALQRAQQPGTPSTLSFDRFVEVLSAISAGQNPSEVLAHSGVSLDLFLEAQRYWLAELGHDEELRNRYLAALRRR